jgi:hypothetical protein
MLSAVSQQEMISTSKTEGWNRRYSVCENILGAMRLLPEHLAE